MPLDFRLRLMRDPHSPIARRLEAAKAVAPFLHPRLNAIDAKLDLVGSDQGPIRLKNIAEPVHVCSLEVRRQANAKSGCDAGQSPRSSFVLVGGGVVALIVVAWGR
jgi:hypothetical protein